MLRDVQVPKFAGPEFVLLPDHHAEFQVVSFVNTKFSVIGFDGFISLVECSS